MGDFSITLDCVTDETVETDTEDLTLTGDEYESEGSAHTSDEEFLDFGEDFEVFPAPEDPPLVDTFPGVRTRSQHTGPLNPPLANTPVDDPWSGQFSVTEEEFGVWVDTEDGGGESSYIPELVRSPQTR